MSDNKVVGRKPFKEIVSVESSHERDRCNSYGGKNVNQLPFGNVNNFSSHRNYGYDIIAVKTMVMDTIGEKTMVLIVEIVTATMVVIILRPFKIISQFLQDFF